jgi:hypothetical protein
MPGISSRIYHALRRRLRALLPHGKSRRSLANSLTSSHFREPDVLFFLTGVPKSGKTWLAQMLDAHPEVFCKGEGSFFPRTHDLKGQIVTLAEAIFESQALRDWHVRWNAWRKPHELESDLWAISKLATEYFMKRDFSQTTKRILGDESPIHATAIEEIYQLFPKSRIIHVVRDGRDVVVSIMFQLWHRPVDCLGNSRVGSDELALRDAFVSRPDEFGPGGRSLFSESKLAQLTKYWARNVRAARQAGPVFGTRYLEVRHEHMRSDPNSELSRVLTFLDADTSAHTVARCLNGKSLTCYLNDIKTEGTAWSFFSNQPPLHWSRYFTERDGKLFKDLAGDLLIELGYER